MANNVIKRIWNQNKMVNIEALQGMAFQAEDGGHTFEISGVDGQGNPVALSGTVAGVFVRPDNADIALSGYASGGKVYVTLSDACYAVTGKFGLTIFVTADSKKTAVYAAIGTVSRTSGGAVAGDTPQDVVDLINAISAAVATIPASYTNLMASVAPTYSNSALYAVGSYVWYDGNLYRCTTAITTAESWTAAHWVKANINNSVSDMSVALGDVCNKISSASVVARFPGYVSLNSDGLSFTSQTQGSNYVCLYIPIDQETTYDFVISDTTGLDRYGYKLTDDISSSWNPGGFTEARSAILTNHSNKYLVVLIAAFSTYTGDVPVSVRRNLARSIVSSVDSMEGSISDLNNIAIAECCDIRARIIDNVRLSGHNVIFTENSVGSNYVNIYVPIEFGAFYKIDFTSFSGLQLYGIKLANTITEATNQGFSGYGNTEYSFRNDGSINKYLVVLLQAISTFNGRILIDVKKEAEKGYVARVGAGYAYSSILGALKGTPDYVELMLTDPVYNVYQEYLDYYGASFWDDYTGYAGQTDMFTAGLWLTGNRKIKGTGSNKVRFQYDGNNNAVKTDFALFAFYPQYSTVEISDFTMLFSGIRYAVHDDFAPINAHIIMDGIVFDGTPYSSAVIGAGLGINSTYIIRNCVFLGNSKIYDISYHGSTNALTTNRCKIYVSNCYGSKTCAFRWYGPSELTSDCIVNNSKFAAIVCQAYDADQPNANMRLIAYCNETDS